MCSTDGHSQLFVGKLYLHNIPKYILFVHTLCLLVYGWIVNATCCASFLDDIECVLKLSTQLIDGNCALENKMFYIVTADVCFV